MGKEDSKTPSKAIISVAWPYANGDLHLGHPAGYLLGAGILNDFLRLKGTDVIMVSGSDMNGTPVAVGAWKNGEEPREYAAKQHYRHIEVMKLLKVNYTLYTSTATKFHEEIVQDVFLKLEKKGYIDKKQTEQYWSEKEHKFLLDRYIEGECPHCGYKEARGDQCDNCGRTLTPDELVNPYSIFGDKELKKKKSTNYYLRLDKLQTLLEKHYKGAEFLKQWRKHVWATTKAWLDEGLEPRAITRDMEGYGVQLPAGHEIKGEDGKVIYVWFEAVIGYLSASKALGNDEQEGEVFMNLYDGQSVKWEDYWFDPGTKSFYFMGKDNIPFHAVIWTAMLLGLNDGESESEQFNLPWNIPANQYLNLKGGKFSKSKGNVIDTREFVGQYGLDAVRYFLITRMPENKDYDFTWKEFVEANNNELVANLGNLMNRTLAFWNKSFAEEGIKSVEIDPDVEKQIKETYEKVENSLMKCRFVEAFGYVMELSNFGNKYFNDSEIWKVVKDDKQKAGEYMFNLLQIVANLAQLVRPFMPDFSENLMGFLDIDGPEPKVGEDNWQMAEFDVEGFGEVENLKPLITKLDPIDQDE